MSKSKSKKRYMSVAGMVLAIIATDFGFGNSITGYNQMGYAGIHGILSVVLFIYFH